MKVGPGPIHKTLFIEKVNFHGWHSTIQYWIVGIAITGGPGVGIGDCQNGVVIRNIGAPSSIGPGTIDDGMLRDPAAIEVIATLAVG
jgi:hypothetical protein